MNYILFHVPHSSLKIPKKFWSISVMEKKNIEKTNLFMCDFLTDKIIHNKCNKLFFKYSRLFFDVERFKEDSKE